MPAKKSRTDAKALKLDPCASGCQRGCAHDKMTHDYTAPKSAHTPGPWEYEKHAMEPSYLISSASEPGLSALAHVRGGLSEDGKSHGLADARLIAAAPDLLEAANKALTELSQIAWLNPGQVNEARVLQLLRAAIAKAEGK